MIRLVMLADLVIVLFIAWVAVKMVKWLLKREGCDGKGK